MLEAAVQQFAADIQQKSLLLGVSGGLDSVVLLYVCYALKLQLDANIKIMHVNHQISPNANAWQTYCEKLALQFKLPFISRQIILPQQKNLEAVARDLRYQAFAAEMSAETVLMTAHHQDDQAETILLQLCRGSGINGLSAMPLRKPFATGTHIRPFLHCTRSDLLQFATEKKIVWLEDESNQFQARVRNRLRHAVLPVLKQITPAVTQNIARSARHCAEAQELLAEYAQQLLITLQGSQPNLISVRKLSTLTFPQQKLALRSWMQRQNVLLPPEKKLLTMLSQVLHAKTDKNPCINWGNISLRRYRDDLYLTAIEMPIPADTQWRLEQSLTIPEVGTLSSSLVKGAGIRTDIETVTVKFRHGGESLLMQGHRQSLKNCWQAWGVPPWLRQCVPLIYAGDEIINVVGYYESHMAAPKSDAWGRSLTLISNH